jgi:hypothetical protein
MGGYVCLHCGFYSPSVATADQPTDPLTKQQDDVAALKDWPKSKQLEAYKLLYNLGIRRDMCDDYDIQREFKKEQIK